MKSRVSCCNGGLVARDLRRTALLWSAYLLLWFVAMPANLFSSSEWMKAMDMRRTVLDLASDTCHLISALYGVAVAWFLFSYLYKSRSANFFGALPLRRETQFLSHYISGILCSLLPNLILFGATVVAGAMLKVNLVMETAIWFAAHSLTFLFYYSFAVLCAMLVGNLIAMPVLYGILNFFAVVVEALVRSLGETLLYGASMSRDMMFGWLSPLYYFAMERNSPDLKRIYENDKLVDLVFEGWPGLLILAAAGLVLAAAAFLIHRRRAMETAGDVVAVKRLRPVFLYVFTYGCAMVIGTLLANMLVRDMDSSQFLPISACLLLAAVIGHFLGHMILQRTLRVFNRKTLTTCAVSLAALIVVLGAMKLDVFGVVRYVPDFDDVAAVRMESGLHNVEDPQRIAEVMELHREILDRKSETEALCRKSDFKPLLGITYVLKNGTEVCREYRLPVNDDNYNDPNSLICKYDELNNTPEMILSRELPQTEVTLQTVDNCVILYEVADKGGYSHAERLEPTSQEALKLWETAILLDLKAGTIGQSRKADDYMPKLEKPGEVAMTYQGPEVTVEYYSGVSVELRLKNAEGSYEHCYYQISAEAVYTKAALVEMGVPQEAFMLKNEAKE